MCCTGSQSTYLGNKLLCIHFIRAFTYTRYSLPFVFRNPFVLGSELCGPALCAQLFCCLLCMAFIALMIFCQPFLNIIINLIFVVY